MVYMIYYIIIGEYVKFGKKMQNFTKNHDKLMINLNLHIGKESQKMNEKKKTATLGADSLSKLFDCGNYTEIGAHVTRRADSDAPEGVVCGYGPVDGRLVFAFTQDLAALNGAFDSRSAKKNRKSL